MGEMVRFKHAMLEENRVTTLARVVLTRCVTLRLPISFNGAIRVISQQSHGSLFYVKLQ
jgi:hypothetical protein